MPRKWCDLPILGEELKNSGEDQETVEQYTAVGSIRFFIFLVYCSPDSAIAGAEGT
jgi:hypothetical protein